MPTEINGEAGFFLEGCISGFGPRSGQMEWYRGKLQKQPVVS
ncbi:hypothetical protein ACFOLF_12460 [Paenibacillus sepulcri]